MSSWTEPEWLAEAHGWIREQVASLGARVVGELDQHHIQPWATVIRVPTDRGDVHFKANTEALRHEAALVTLLSARRPDCVPPLLAVERGRGWMLMADAGIKLREIGERERDLSCWLELLPLYAGFQTDLADDAATMVSLGVPDLRLATLPAKFEQLLSELVALPAEERKRLERSVPRVRALCDELAGCGIPETIQHDDFHDGQVYVRDDRYVLLDWGDACVSHPFFTLSVTLEGSLAWGSTTSRARSTSSRSVTPISRRSPVSPTARTSWRRQRSRCGSAGSAARSMRGSAARRTPTPACTCGCSSTAALDQPFLRRRLAGRPRTIGA